MLYQVHLSTTIQSCDVDHILSLNANFKLRHNLPFTYIVTRYLISNSNTFQKKKKILTYLHMSNTRGSGLDNLTFCYGWPFLILGHHWFFFQFFYIHCQLHVSPIIHKQNNPNPQFNLNLILINYRGHGWLNELGSWIT
jgi:hypothetical protein